MYEEKTEPGATQCRSAYIAKTIVSQPLIFLWHTHGMIRGATFTLCPTQEAGSHAWPEPSKWDYEGQEAHPTAPMFIMETQDLIIVYPHIGTDSVSRKNATQSYNHSRCANWAS